jgi:hypothetical protein
MDLIFAAAWFSAFGILVSSLYGRDCGATFSWSGITHASFCSRWTVAEAFSFLSAIFWLVSAIVGICFIAKMRTERDVASENVK